MITSDLVKEAITDLGIEFLYHPANRKSQPTEENILRKIEELNDIELSSEEIDGVRFILVTDEDIVECSDPIYFV